MGMAKGQLLLGEIRERCRQAAGPDFMAAAALLYFLRKAKFVQKLLAPNYRLAQSTATALIFLLTISCSGTH